MLDRGADEELKIDRAHRIRKPPGVREDVPRDVIIKFHLYEDKAKIWSKLRGIHPVQYENIDIHGGWWELLYLAEMF